MEIVSKRITNWLIESSVIDPEDRQLYIYAIQSLLITIAPVITILIIAAVLGTIWEFVCLLIPFLCIRKFCGGYHAKSFGLCYLSSCGLITLGMIVSTYLRYGVWISILTVMAVFSLIYLSPVDSENKKLDEEEKMKYKKTTMALSVIFCVIHLLLLFLKDKSWGISVAYGLWLSAGLQLPCISQNQKRGKGLL